MLDHLLRGQAKVTRINSEGAFFRTPGGAEVAMPELSDGYRSFIALVVDMLRHLLPLEKEFSDELTYDADADRLFLDVEGVVLIDEADAHLHPIWQRHLGSRLREMFPRMQFIVTSHSPFIAQAASDAGLFVVRQHEKDGPVRVSQPERSVKGWRAEQILLSPLFGLTETRDEETADLIKQHADLTAKKTWGSLSLDDQKTLAELESKLSTRLTGATLLRA